MARRKSQGTDAVYQPWEELAFRSDHLSLEEKVATWKELYNSCHDGQQLKVSVDDACLVTGKGIHFAWEQRRYDDIVHLCREWFNHPDQASADKYDKVHFACKLGTGLFLSGDQRQAIEVIDDLVFNGTPVFYKLSWMDALRDYTSAFEFEPDYKIEPTFADHLSRLIAPRRGGKRLSVRVKSITSAREMHDAIGSFPYKAR